MTEQAPITKTERDLIAHALGWPKDYRNHFAAEPSSNDFLAWQDMERSGLAQRGRTINQPPNELVIFHVTTEGRKAFVASRKRAADSATAIGRGRWQQVESRSKSGRRIGITSSPRTF